MSAFPFENYLGQIKHILHKPPLPLQQVVKMLSEMPNPESPKPHECNLSQPHFDDTVLHSLSLSTQSRKVVTQKYTLSIVQGDNCVQIVGHIAILRNIIKVDGVGIFVLFQKFNNQESFFSDPFESTSIGCYKELHDNLDVARLQDIKLKYFLCPDKNVFIAMPLIHMT